MEQIRYYLYFILGRLRQQYFMQIPEDDKAYEKSRIWFIVDGASATTIGLLAAGAFLASLLRTLGISDSFNGMISAIPSLAALMQLAGVELAKGMPKVKLFVCSVAIIHRMLFGFLYFIPFLSFSAAWKIILCIMTFFIAHMLGQLIAPIAGNWVASLVTPATRGKYFSRRDCIMVLVSVIVSLGVGKVFDTFKALQNPELKFLFISALIVMLGVVNFIALSCIKEPHFSYVSLEHKEIHGRLVKKRVAKNKNKEEEKFKVTFKKVISDEAFRGSIILTVLWQTAFFFSTPYFGIYQISYLKLSYTYIMIMGFAGSVIRMIATPFSGRIADQKSWALVLKNAFLIMAWAFIINAFTVPKNARVMFAIYSLLTGLAWAGIAPGLFAIQLDIAPGEDKTAYLGINAALMGLSGFLSAIVGGVVLQGIINRGHQILGYPIYGQQVLSLGSGMMVLVLVKYMKWKFKKYIE